MTWLELLRVVNAAGAVTVMVMLLTLPGGPSTRAMGFLTYAMAMYSAVTAYGSIALLDDPAVMRPIIVFVAMSTSMVGTFLVRQERIGYMLWRPRRGRHREHRHTRVPVQAR